VFQPLWAALTTAGVGAASWLVVSTFDGRREAWDSPLYFMGAMPVVAMTAAAVAFFVPSRSWRWAMFPFAGQALVAFLQNPTANLLPLGLIVFFVLGLVCLVPTSVAAFAGRRMMR
jgi:hypothetical protein